MHCVRFGSAVVMVAALTAMASAADVPADSLKFNNGVVRAANGFETVSNNYVVANPTSVFSDHFYYGGRVTGDLKRSDRVDVLAKVKGYDWVPVGRGGNGIGYVPISWRQEPGQAARQHRFARARRADHQYVVTAGGGDFERALGGLLTFHVAQIGNRDGVARREPRFRSQNFVGVLAA